MSEQAATYTTGANYPDDDVSSDDLDLPAARPPDVLRLKVVRPETRVVDAAAGRVSAVLSTEDRDRDGDRIIQSGWKLDQFLTHPILLSSHNYASLRGQIGEWEDVAVKGKRLVGTARYYIGEGNEEADWAFRLASKGRAAYSVGFIPDMDKAVPLDDKDMFGGLEFRGQELLEVSHVTVPSNPHALQRMALSTAIHPLLRDLAREELEETEIGLLRRAVADLQADVDMLTGILICRALPPHTTPMADEDAEWDAGAEVRAAEGRAALRRMHAWVDPDADPETKAAYKLPHHRASGEVVWRGVAAAMAALMGGRGGVDIPDDDRRGVHAHLRRHYEQFDREAPELRLHAPPDRRAINYPALFRAGILEGLRDDD